MSENAKPTKALLLLADGTVFEGRGIGAEGVTAGEIAFNTGMYGYQEIFTDPSYFGQLLVMATSHIGNYGVHDTEIESDSLKIAGLITKKFSDIFSRVSGKGTLQEYLQRDGVVGIADVDTRALVRHIREKGAMNAIIATDGTTLDTLKRQLKEVPSMEGLELSSKVTTSEIHKVEAENEICSVALLDLGTKKNIIRCLTDRGASVTVYPMHTPAHEIIAAKHDGILISNGPGDPAAMKNVIKTAATLIESGTPVFGICLGHQIIALSQGLATEKMFNGHRGVNHPVKNLINGKCEITSQNHGFVVSTESIAESEQVELTHTHLNDLSVAGLRLKNKPAFSVQYHPEASAGPHDGRYLFDEFITLIKEHKSA